MKDYIGQIVDLRGDTRINPRGVAYGDGSGTHQRALNKITSNQTHTAGATVVDYATATHISMVSKGILVEHNQDGRR